MGKRRQTQTSADDHTQTASTEHVQTPTNGNCVDEEGVSDCKRVKNTTMDNVMCSTPTHNTPTTDLGTPDTHGHGPEHTPDSATINHNLHTITGHVLDTPQLQHVRQAKHNKQMHAQQDNVLGTIARYLLLEDKVSACTSTSTSTTSMDSPPATTDYDTNRQVRFDGVTVYLFERAAGVSAVPSVGANTIGMSDKHHQIQQMTLIEHEQDCRSQRRHRHQLGAATYQMDNDTEDEDEGEGEDGQGDDEGEDNALGTDNMVHEHDEEEEEEEEEELDGDHMYLQPLSARERKCLLVQNGVSVRAEEKEECDMIRQSRQSCGCTCERVCVPATCECALMNIKCQVDRPSFPCGCTRTGCCNPSGRVEFNPSRVRSHYMKTMMSLRLQSQGGTPQQRARLRSSCGQAGTSHTQTHPASAYFIHSPSQHVRFTPDPNSYCDEAPFVRDCPQSSTGSDTPTNKDSPAVCTSTTADRVHPLASLYAHVRPSTQAASNTSVV